MPNDYKALLEELDSLSQFFASLTLKQQYEFHRQVHETMPLHSSLLWRSMVKVAQRIKQECEHEQRKAKRVQAVESVG